MLGISEMKSILSPVTGDYTMYSADKAAYIAMTSIKWGGMLVDED
jgi:hypothetical protein